MVSVSKADGAVGGAQSRERPQAALDDSTSYGKFVLSGRSHKQQYAQIYFCRLTELRPKLAEAARRAWGDDPLTVRHANTLIGAGGTPEVDSVAIGILYKDLKAKPSILAEYAKASSEQLVPLPPARSLSLYADAEGSGRIFLEDETARFELDVGEVSAAFRRLATGLIIAVCGRENKESGSFRVSRVTCVGAAPQPPLANLSADRYVLFVSGLGLGDPSGKVLATELLLEYIRANLGDEEDEASSASIVHVVIAGNSVFPASSASPTSNIATALLKPHIPVAASDQMHVAAPMVQVDRFVSAAAAAVPVSLMPGANDPANYFWPQQPIHRCLLPSASRCKNLERVPNPYRRTVDGRLLLGTSGLNIDDYVLYDPDAALYVARQRDALCKPKQTTETDAKMSNTEGANGEGANGEQKANVGNGFPCTSVALDVMETLLDNRHIAPTAPDTLAAYPFYDKDPFIIEATPHVFFAGNQPEYATRLYTCNAKDPSEDIGPIRLISIPRFDATGLVVMVNLRTLDTSVAKFSNDLL